MEDAEAGELGAEERVERGSSGGWKKGGPERVKRGGQNTLKGWLKLAKMKASGRSPTFGPPVRHIEWQEPIDLHPPIK